MSAVSISFQSVQKIKKKLNVWIEIKTQTFSIHLYHRRINKFAHPNEHGWGPKLLCNSLIEGLRNWIMIIDCLR